MFLATFTFEGEVYLAGRHGDWAAVEVTDPLDIELDDVEPDFQFPTEARAQTLLNRTIRLFVYDKLRNAAAEDRKAMKREIESEVLDCELIAA